MQRLCVLVTMGACLVASVPADVAVIVQRKSTQVNLTKSELTELHKCMCRDDYIGCTFFTGQGVVWKRPNASEDASSTQYLNVYMCTLFITYIECTRNTQNGQQIIDDQRQNNSFSLHNTDTCDISCVDVMWGGSDTNVRFYTNKIAAELCSMKSLSGSQNMTHTTTIIIISVIVSCIVVIIVIAVVIRFCVCNKRKGHFRNPTLSTDKSQAGSYPEIDKSFGLYAISSEASRHPDPDKEQEPLYFEIEKNKQDSHEFRDSIPLESSNLYSQLHDKTEHVVNTYDVLPR